MTATMAIRVIKRDCDRCNSVGAIEWGICQNCLAPEERAARAEVLAIDEVDRQRARRGAVRIRRLTDDAPTPA